MIKEPDNLHNLLTKGVTYLPAKTKETKNTKPDPLHIFSQHVK